MSGILDIDELLDTTQRDFWAVNMGKPPEYDPIRETEYLVRPTLADAEEDDEHEPWQISSREARLGGGAAAWQQ